LVFKTTFLFGVVLGLISIVIGLIYIYCISNRLYASLEISIQLLCLLAMPSIFLNQFLQSIFQGLQEFSVLNKIIVLNQAITLGLTLLFIIILKLGVFGAVFGYVVGGALTFIICVVRYVPRAWLQCNMQLSILYIKELLAYGLKAFISNILAFINYRANLFLLAYFCDMASVGIYSVALNFGEKLWIISQAISLVLFPKIASMHNDAEKNKITTVLTRNVLLLYLVAGLVLYSVSDNLMVILFGDQFKESSAILSIMIPGITALAAERILSNDLAGRGRPEINTCVSCITVMLNTVLNFHLIPKFGIYGASWATTVTYIVTFIIKGIVFKKITGVNYKDLLLIGIDDLKIIKWAKLS